MATYEEVLARAYSLAHALTMNPSTTQGIESSEVRIVETRGQYSFTEGVNESFQRYVQQNKLGHLLKTMKNGEVISLDKSIAQGIATIVENLNQNKYLYSILMTCLVEKIVHPAQDIRFAQADLPSGYSNRSTDQIHITPFLKIKGLTACAASGVESGRNFERPYAYRLDYIGKPRGSGNLEAFLGILHAVQEEGFDPFSVLVLLMALDIHKKVDVSTFDYPSSKELTIQEIFNAVLRHFEEAKGNGKARLPVLAIQAIYQSLVPELARYNGTVLRSSHRHTGNDKEGWIGDVQVDRSDGSPYEAVEVKSGKQIDVGILLTLPRKFHGNVVDRYYILSTCAEYIAPDKKQEIMKTVELMRLQTGCQIIVNGLHRSIWYYLRMIAKPNEFLLNYTSQVLSDSDVKDEHRVLWSNILKDVQSESSM